jgi:ABC-type phosphate transport system auxiliary subunit
MITDADITKMKKVFATKAELKKLSTKFVTKTELKALDTKVDRGFIELVDYIGETKAEILNELREFREEMRMISNTHQSTLNNHEVRIAKLEFI